MHNMQYPDQPQQYKRPSLAKIFISFLHLGLTAFDGPVMVAYIKRLTVDREHWIDEESFREGVSFCQIVPGATAMQTSAYVGLEILGWAGALAVSSGSLPLMFHEVIDVHGWLDSHTYLNGIALGQVTPGHVVRISRSVLCLA